MNTRSFRLLALSCITIDMVREIAFVLFLMLTPPCYYTVIPVTSHVLEIRLEDKSVFLLRMTFSPSAMRMLATTVFQKKRRQMSPVNFPK